ncbi:hypothetical protein MMA89_25775, partial [Salmonella enterica]|nr:hypothetical protein [Salmonella enterica]
MSLPAVVQLVTPHACLRPFCAKAMRGMFCGCPFFMSQTNESFAALFEESIAKSNMKAGEVISA